MHMTAVQRFRQPLDSALRLLLPCPQVFGVQRGCCASWQGGRRRRAVLTLEGTRRARHRQLGDEAGRAQGAQRGVLPAAPRHRAALARGHRRRLDHGLVPGRRRHPQAERRRPASRLPSYATSLSGHSVIIKKIQLPAMPAGGARRAIQWEAEQYIPFDINDVRLDYVVLSEGEPGRENMEVLLVAVKRDKVNDYVSVISQAGKVAGPGRRRRLRASRTPTRSTTTSTRSRSWRWSTWAPAVTNINILARGQTAFWRDISFGGNQFTEALQREFNLSFEQAERAEARPGGGPLHRRRRPRRCSTASRPRWPPRSRRPSTSSPPPPRRDRWTRSCSPAAAR